MILTELCGAFFVAITRTQLPLMLFANCFCVMVLNVVIDAAVMISFWATSVISASVCFKLLNCAVFLAELSQLFVFGKVRAFAVSVVVGVNCLSGTH